MNSRSTIAEPRDSGGGSGGQRPRQPSMPSSPSSTYGVSVGGRESGPLSSSSSSSRGGSGSPEPPPPPRGRLVIPPANFSFSSGLSVSALPPPTPIGTRVVMGSVPTSHQVGVSTEAAALEPSAARMLLPLVVAVPKIRQADTVRFRSLPSQAPLSNVTAPIHREPAIAQWC